uniref:Uncharacterized protein n=1 Tax=Oryza meridionalis TaxID=40149 RepID=A0A0E0DUY9_9ORYZ
MSTGRGVRGRQQGGRRRRPTADWLRRLLPAPFLIGFCGSGRGQPTGLQLKARQRQGQQLKAPVYTLRPVVLTAEHGVCVFPGQPDSRFSC